MVWPVAALAVLLLGFVVIYGSIVQVRLERMASTGALEEGAEPHP